MGLLATYAKIGSRMDKISTTGECDMQQKKTFSTMEIVLLIVLIGSLILSFLQARRQEEKQQ
jgi:hypothetical protein